ncbi:hypothetical protein U1Q18_046030 [Sarracenia purpurea var. burkii]
MAFSGALTGALEVEGAFSGAFTGALKVEGAFSEINAGCCEDDSVDCEVGSVDWEEDPEGGCATDCVVVERVGEASCRWNRGVDEQEFQVEVVVDAVLERPKDERAEAS